MQPHDRAVNQVLFGGPTGNYLLSAGQDGCIKLWDIRAARFSSNILKTSSPIQRIIFSPSPSQPWTLLACCSSGTFLRYDLRNLSSSGKPGTAVTDRVAGHVGAVLGVDWREGYSSSTGSQAGLGGSSFEMVPGVDIGPSGGGVGSSGFGGAGMGNAGAGSDPTREGGWVVTCGLDRTIKVWDFSLPSLSTKPVRTLFASQPVQDVAWNPDPRRGSEIISCPMLGVGIAAEGSTGSSAGGSSSSLDLAGGVTAALASGKGWKNEVELWDTRRSYLPKCSIKTEDPISSLVFNDDETIWATSKTSPTFHQYDVKSDSFSLMDSVPPVGAQWNPTGALWFAGASPGSQKGWSASGTPTNNLEESVNIETDKFKPDVSLAVVGDLDLGAGGEGGFDSREFGFLAENLVLNPWGEGGNVGVEDQAFGEVCETNAEAYRIAGRTDAVQLWKTIKIWLNEGTSILPDSPPATPPVPPPSTLRVLPVTGDAPLDIDEWLQSPVTIAPTASARRQSFNSLSREAISRSRVRSLNQSPIIHPADLPPIQKTVLDDFSEESTSSDIENKSKIASGALLAPGSIVANMVSTPAPTMDEMTSSDSEHERSTARLRALTVTATSNGSGGPPPNKLVSSLVALQSQGASRGRSGTLSQIGHFTTLAAEPPLDFADDDDFHLPPSRASSGSRLHSRRPSSSSGSDDSDGDGSHIARVRAAKIMARSRTTGESSSGTGGSGNRSSRRGSSSVSADRRPRMTPLDADAFMGQVSRRTSIDRRTATGMSRRGSAQMAAQSTDRETMPTIVKPKGPSSKELRQVEGQKYLRDARDIVKQQIVVALQDYADKGDCQLCATVCCALQKKDLPCDSLFIARVTKAYLGLLRQNKLYTAAASLIKYCSVSSINGLSQNGVVYHTACGRCGKALDQPPAFGYCAKCSNHEPTRCCIWYEISFLCSVFKTDNGGMLLQPPHRSLAYRSMCDLWAWSSS
ncbi:WD40 repeat-like protein [Meredithblackwellia eburnea MCA 4105]